jgi:uncharacterized protein YcfL
MKHLTRTTSLLVLTLGALLGGCQTHHPRGTATNTYRGNAVGEREEFIGDRDLKARFVMHNIRSETRDDRLRVQFDLKNTTPADLPVEWAIRWFDASGFAIDTNPHWRPVMVTGSGFHTIQATAPTTDARTWKLELRRPTPID